VPVKPVGQGPAHRTSKMRERSCKNVVPTTNSTQTTELNEPQDREPAVLVHSERGSQPPLPVRHSSISVPSVTRKRHKMRYFRACQQRTGKLLTLPNCERMTHRHTSWSAGSRGSPSGTCCVPQQKAHKTLSMRSGTTCKPTQQAGRIINRRWIMGQHGRNSKQAASGYAATETTTQ
jgi:hypothetical protein